MSIETVKLRNELLLDALANGWFTPKQVQAPYSTLVAPARIARWFERLYAPLEPQLPGARLVNHFSLGADPEFVLLDLSNSKVVNARNFGLKAGLAFGADNNGRLIELRPKPSRSALSVLTSTWLTLQWMVVYHPDTAIYKWRSGAYAGGDGLGGHIHFGRKQLQRRLREVQSLDRLTHLCFTAGIFSREEGRMRYHHARGILQGDKQYGSSGDIRVQPHGYEYRTLPSWLDSPWLAYFLLTISKLVVALPEVLPPLTGADDVIAAEASRNWLRLLLAYFSPLDDDARLAYAILCKHGFPRHNDGDDFKPNWGIFLNGPLGSSIQALKPVVWPTQIPCTTKFESAMMTALLNGEAPETTELTPTWFPTGLPPNYYQCIDFVQTELSPGLGEFCADVVFHKDCKLVFCGNNNNNATVLTFPESIKINLRTQLKEVLAPLQINFTGADFTIFVSTNKKFTLEMMLLVKNTLLDSKVLPLWRAGEVTDSSFAEWQRQSRTVADRAPVRFRDKLILKSDKD